MDKRILYIEASSGASGDMFLGALLDLGVAAEVLHEVWNQLSLDNYEVEIFETQKCGVRALRCRVTTEEKSGPRTWRQLEAVLQHARIKDSIRKDALSLCRQLLELEASIHRTSLSRLHLHEMGGTDLLIDVVGTLAAVDSLQPAQITASSVNTGRGFIQFSHGHFPIPTPATTNLLVGMPVFQNEAEGELTTPTGALLLTHLARSFGPLPSMTLQKTGVGAGEKEIPGHPNVLRIFQGIANAVSSEEDVYMVETNVDDSNPQILAYFMEKALQKGALDVFFTPIFMKKNRPAVRVSVLTPHSLMEPVVHLLFSETTAIGLRYWKVDRKKLDRRWKNLRIGRLSVRIKESFVDGILYNYQPEYEDCRKIAEKLNRPIKEILSEAIHLYLKSRK